MRVSLLVLVAGIAGAVSVVACSGSSPEAEPTGEPSPQLPESNGELGGSDPSPSAPADNTSPDEDGETPDAAAPDGGDGDGGDGGGGMGGGGGGGMGGGGGGGGGGGAGPSQCAQGSIQETEPNDTAAAANAIPNKSGSFCGTLATAADVDHVTFTLPTDATFLSFGAAYSRNGAEFDVTVNGKTFQIGQTPQVVPGAKYVIKAYTKGTSALNYRIDVEIRK